MADIETLVVYPSSFDSEHAYASVSSYYPTSNPIGQSSSNTTYTQINLTTGSSAETYFYYNFDLSTIPEGATINSVSCSYKAYISTTSTSYVNTRSAQLYSGSTAKGSAGTFSTNATVMNLTAGTWTRDELQNARLRLYAKRGTSRTTSTYYIRFYGATLTVEYVDNATIYTVTVQSGDSTVTDKDGMNEVREGKPFTVSISNSVSSITDNGLDVSGSIVEQTAPDKESVVSYPTTYTTSGSISSTKYQNAIGKSSSNTESGNDYCSYRGSTATITYSFDFSEIPENATIESVSVVVGGHLESTTSSSEVANLQLYSGGTAKGKQSSFSSTSKQLITMDAGTWTRDELQDAKLAFTIGYYGGLVNGADFTVVYSTPMSGGKYYTYTITSVYEDHEILINLGAGESTRLRVKVSGSWKKVKKVYVKTDSSTWEEVTDIDNIFTVGTKFKKG